jgi:hypothetical protein
MLPELRRHVMRRRLYLNLLSRQPYRFCRKWQWQ